MVVWITLLVLEKLLLGIKDNLALSAVVVVFVRPPVFQTLSPRQKVLAAVGAKGMIATDLPVSKTYGSRHKVYITLYTVGMARVGLEMF
jgi:hypothetical protein